MERECLILPEKEKAGVTTLEIDCNTVVFCDTCRQVIYTGNINKPFAKDIMFLQISSHAKDTSIKHLIDIIEITDEEGEGAFPLSTF